MGIVKWKVFSPVVAFRALGSVHLRQTQHQILTRRDPFPLLRPWRRSASSSRTVTRTPWPNSPRSTAMSWQTTSRSWGRSSSTSIRSRTNSKPSWKRCNRRSTGKKVDWSRGSWCFVSLKYVTSLLSHSFLCHEIIVFMVSYLCNLARQTEYYLYSKES